MSHDLLSHAHVTATAALMARARDLAIWVKSVAVAWKNRREAMKMLAQMDNRMLRDIGLHASDVRSALAEPGWSDPTVRLKLQVVERRAASREAAREIAGLKSAKRTNVKVAC